MELRIRRALRDAELKYVRTVPLLYAIRYSFVCGGSALAAAITAASSRSLDPMSWPRPSSRSAWPLAVLSFFPSGLLAR